MDRPSLFSEARLPEGFPPPGPVGQVIVKEYPPYRAALVNAAELADGGQDSMFQSLFRHIQRNDIPMTAPVEMQFQKAEGEAGKAAPLSMAFLYRSTAVGKTGSDQDVMVVDLPAMTVLSVGARGSYGASTFQDGMKQIQEHLAVNPGRYELLGPPRFLGYNSPFVPWFLRYSETQVPVKRR